MGPAYFRILASKIRWARILQIVVEAILGETVVKKVPLYFKSV
jgi:hypothetical protein